MRRLKRLPTRKREALRRAVWALVLLLAVQNLLQLGLLLPIQAIHSAEEREGVYGTRVLRRLWEPDIYKSSLFYLSASENAVVLSDAHLTYLGWFPQFGNALDCSSPAPLYAAERSIARGGNTGYHLFFYGRVDDPAIETVEFSLRYISGYDEAKRENLFQEHIRLTVPEEDWIERDGHRYFLLSYRLEDWPYQTGEYTFVTGRNAAGETVVESPVTESASASYG